MEPGTPDPHETQKPLTKNGLLSVAAYKLWEIEEMGMKTGKIIPEERERFTQIEQVLQNTITEDGGPIAKQLLSALTRVQMLPGVDENRKKVFVEQIQSTLKFLRGEMSLSTEREPGYQDWLSKQQH